MPKIKTHKATAKRFKYSGTGKLLRTRGPKATCAVTRPPG